MNELVKQIDTTRQAIADIDRRLATRVSELERDDPVYQEILQERIATGNRMRDLIKQQIQEQRAQRREHRHHE